MAKTKEVGTEQAPKRQCAFCEEPFDGPEFWSFMLQRKTRTFDCIRCDNTNFFVQADKNNKVGLIFLCTSIFISLIPVILGVMWVIAFYLELIDVLWLWAPIVAAALTTALINASIKLNRWLFYKVQDTSFELKMDFS